MNVLVKLKDVIGRKSTADKMTFQLNLNFSMETY